LEVPVSALFAARCCTIRDVLSNRRNSPVADTLSSPLFGHRSVLSLINQVSMRFLYYGTSDSSSTSCGMIMLMALGVFTSESGSSNTLIREADGKSEHAVSAESI
jgi:hypothetical protein